MVQSPEALPPPVKVEEAFAYLALEGAQFNEEGMPAATAAEVVAYSQAVYQVARDLLLAQSGASRVPTAFTKAFDLRLVSIEEGSARPKLILRKPESVRQEDFDTYAPIFQAARDAVTDALIQAATDYSLPVSFPRRAVTPLKRLGASLDDDSRLVVGAPTGGPNERASVTTTTRAVLRQITTILEADQEEADEVDAIGVITEYDSVHWTFDLRRESDRRMINCRIVGNQESLAREAKRALSINGIVGADVKVSGLAYRNADGDFGLIFDVDGISVERTINEKAIMSRVQQMRALNSGWWGADSEPPSIELIELVEGLSDHLRDLDQQIAVAPTADGGIEFEWRMQGSQYTAALGPAGKMAFYVDNLTTDELSEHEQPLDRDVLLHFLQSGSW